MRMIGLLGGSFDPVHSAHLAMADACAEALQLDELRFLPAAQPWQKDDLQASGDQRVAMLAAALAGHRPSHGRYLIDTREIQRSGKTYTIDTLAEVRAEIGLAMPLVFIFGADQLVQLDTWRDWQRLWEFAHLVAVSRPGFDWRRLPTEVEGEWRRRRGDVQALRSSPCGNGYLLDTLALDISATDIRAALASHTRTGDDRLPGLVPPAVLDYIRANHLYRS